MPAQAEIEEYYDHLWNVLLPRGGFIVIYQAYADASGVNGPILSVASFLFEYSHAKALNDEWSSILNPFIKDLPEHKRYFNMSDFYGRRSPWEHISEGTRDALRRELIESAKQHTEQGSVSSVRLKDYEAEIARDDQRDAVGSAFTMCNIWCMQRISDYLKRFRADDEIAYAFEDGDADKDNLKIRLAKIEASSYLRKKYKYYGGHTFLPKHAHHALGAADLLAWEYRNSIQDHFANPKEFNRPFLDALFERPVIGARHFDSFNLKFHNLAQAIERANVWAEERESE